MKLHAPDAVHCHHEMMTSYVGSVCCVTDEMGLNG